MLKNVPPLLSPDLLKALSEMGCGDEIVLADGNFPSAAVARRLIRADAATINALLDAVLSVIPLDAQAEMPVVLMGCGASPSEPPIWERLRYLVERHEGERKFRILERDAFIERAKRAYVVVATGDREMCASIILRKGLIVLDGKEFRL
ncbi:MAG: fucose isomerase [Oscillospiraceae bacterium]|jgi:L-fucose mutarotase|nr:fucose isomerase [Oscillospiraceae bacterium]